MNGFFSLPMWSPYIVGVGIGLLVCLALVVSDRPIGCSTAFVKATGLIEQLVRGRRVQEKEYYRKFPPRIDWQFIIVPGIVIGAFISSFLSGTFGLFIVPPLWAAQFGDSSCTSGSSQPSPGEFSSVLEQGGLGVVQAGTGSVDRCSSRSEASCRLPVSLWEV